MLSTSYVLTETSFQLQLFLGTTDKVYIVDKTENNPTPIHGHPAWAAGTPPISIMRESSRVRTSSSSRVFDFQKFSQAHGYCHEFILCGAGFCHILASAVCLNLRQGGNVLGNGTWVNVGGNQAVTYGGATALSQNGDPPYNDPDGGQS